MCWPQPERSRSCSATSTAQAASPPVFAHTWGTEMRTGGRSRSPVRDTWPLAAARVRSVATQPALGPVAPKGERETVIKAGVAPAQRVEVRGRRGAPHSMSTSAPAARRSSSSAARSRTTTDDLPRS